MAKKDGPPRSQEFIDDSDAALDEGSNDSDAKPKSSKGKKKAAESSDKKSSKKRKVDDDDQAEGSSASSFQKGSDGNFADLGGTRRITVRAFKGKTYIDIREFYEEKGSGDMKPGKKGISLNVEAWETLKGLIEDVDAEVAKLQKK